jgi:hypothetical protein
MKHLWIGSTLALVAVGCGLELGAAEESAPVTPAATPSSTARADSDASPPSGGGADAAIPSNDAGPVVVADAGSSPVPDATSSAPQYLWRCSSVARPQFNDYGTCLTNGEKLCRSNKPDSACDASDRGKQIYANCPFIKCNSDCELLSTTRCTCTLK